MTEKEFAYMKLGTYDTAYALLVILGILMVVFGVLAIPFSLGFAWGLSMSGFFMWGAALIARAYYLNTKSKIAELTRKGN